MPIRWSVPSRFYHYCTLLGRHTNREILNASIIKSRFDNSFLVSSTCITIAGFSANRILTRSCSPYIANPFVCMSSPLGIGECHFQQGGYEGLRQRHHVRQGCGGFD